MKKNYFPKKAACFIFVQISLVSGLIGNRLILITGVNISCSLWKTVTTFVRVKVKKVMSSYCENSFMGSTAPLRGSLDPTLRTAALAYSVLGMVQSR